MAKMQPLKLSDLRPGLDYPVVGPPQELSERRCLFHVKLTDFSMRSIESLINSDKDACFSLWFADGGGTISIPGSKDYRKFTFKTSQGDIDGLECVHQALDSARQPQLNCWGQIRYKLQVQGTEEVYTRTMKLMKETEEQKQKTRTQTINFPHSSKGRKSGGHPGRHGGGRPLSKTSSPFSAPSAPPSSHSFSSSSSATGPASSGSVSGASFSSKFSSVSGSSGGSSGLATNGSSGSVGNSNLAKVSGGRKSSKAPHTLKERIIHLLAVKPQRRSDIISRLKKETKRGETAMTKTDSLLQEVADVQGDVYHLKQSLYSELCVDDWPFYSDTERQLVKRKHGGGGGELFGDFIKRSSSGAREPPPAKRQKLSHPPSSTPPPPLQAHTQPTKKSSPPPSSKSSGIPPAHSSHFNMPLFGGLDSSNSANLTSNIEMHLSSSMPQPQTSNQNPSRPQTQYPGSVFSNFMRSSTSLSSLPPPSLATTTNSSAPDPLQVLQQRASNLQTARSNLPIGRTSSGGPSADVEGGVAGLATGGGRLFGDLVSGETGASSDLTTEAAELLTKKKKKKKNSHKTKDKPLPKAPPEEKEVKEGVVKRGEAGRDVKGKSEEVKVGGKRDKAAIKSEPTFEENGASSTTPSSVDLELRFPPIASDTTRAEYKRIFNEEYQEYLTLKGQVEVVNKEVTALSNQMAAVKKGTDEAKMLKRKIREKYTELQQNKKYQSQKRRFQELHTKLGHLKKLVVAYDQSH